MVSHHTGKGLAKVPVLPGRAARPQRVQQRSPQRQQDKHPCWWGTQWERGRGEAAQRCCAPHWKRRGTLILCNGPRVPELLPLRVKDQQLEKAVPATTLAHLGLSHLQNILITPWISAVICQCKTALETPQRPSQTSPWQTTLRVLTETKTPQNHL